MGIWKLCTIMSTFLLIQNHFRKKNEFKRNPLYSTWILPAHTKNISLSILFGRNEDTNL